MRREDQDKGIKREIEKKATKGKTKADAGEFLEPYQVVEYTPAGDRITPYEADEDLGEKGNMQE